MGEDFLKSNRNGGLSALGSRLLTTKVVIVNSNYEANLCFYHFIDGKVTFEAIFVKH